MANMKTCGQVNKDPVLAWIICIWNAAQKEKQLLFHFEWMDGFWGALLGLQNTGWSYPPLLLLGPHAKRGHDNMMPSVLYVTCLELYSVGAGSETAWDNTVILQKRERHNMKHTKSNMVITLAVLLKFREEILVSHWIIPENVRSQFTSV